jgi:NTE family protein
VALDVLDPFNLRRRLGTLNAAREALLPLPLVDRQKPVGPDAVFPPLEAAPIASLQGKRIGLIGSGGSGACVALVGVARAFEEAGIRPAAISSCSGSALWGAMWAAGLTAREMAELSLSWRPQDYLDIQWAKLPRFAFSALRGFTGLAKGQALERLFDRRLWHMSAGETEIPLHTVVYNVDRGRVEYFGSSETPDLTLGELARIAVDAVRVEGDLYVDGGAVDGFPAEPLEAHGELDHVFGLNVLLPRGLEGEHISGWESRLELARRSRRRLGGRLTLIEPVSYSELRDVAFYDMFLDRRRWPRLMRRGYDSTVEALRPFRRA